MLLWMSVSLEWYQIREGSSTILFQKKSGVPVLLSDKKNILFSHSSQGELHFKTAYVPLFLFRAF